MCMLCDLIGETHPDDATKEPLLVLAPDMRPVIVLRTDGTFTIMTSDEALAKEAAAICAREFRAAQERIATTVAQIANINAAVVALKARFPSIGATKPRAGEFNMPPPGGRVLQ